MLSHTFVSFSACVVCPNTFVQINPIESLHDRAVTGGTPDQWKINLSSGDSRSSAQSGASTTWKQSWQAPQREDAQPQEQTCRQTQLCKRLAFKGYCLQRCKSVAPKHCVHQILWVVSQPRAEIHRKRRWTSWLQLFCVDEHILHACCSGKKAFTHGPRCPVHLATCSEILQCWWPHCAHSKLVQRTHNIVALQHELLALEIIASELYHTFGV